MPTKLESDGKSRKKTPIAFVVWLGPPPGEKGNMTSIECAGSDEVLKTKRVKVETSRTENGEVVIEDRTRDVWVPERINRVFLRNIPEPIYQPEDLDKFRNHLGWKILTRQEAEKYPRGTRA